LLPVARSPAAPELAERVAKQEGNSKNLAMMTRGATSRHDDGKLGTQGDGQRAGCCWRVNGSRSQAIRRTNAIAVTAPA
jgi:hypothetical protein